MRDRAHAPRDAGMPAYELVLIGAVTALLAVAALVTVWPHLGPRDGAERSAAAGTAESD